MGTCELAIKYILFEMFSLREGGDSIKKSSKKSRKNEATRNLLIITLYAFEGCKEESKENIVSQIRLCNHFR